MDDLVRFSENENEPTFSFLHTLVTLLTDRMLSMMPNQEIQSRFNRIVQNDFNHFRFYFRSFFANKLWLHFSLESSDFKKTETKLPFPASARHYYLDPNFLCLLYDCCCKSFAKQQQEAAMTDNCCYCSSR